MSTFCCFCFDRIIIFFPGQEEEVVVVDGEVGAGGGVGVVVVLVGIRDQEMETGRMIFPERR